MVQVDDLVLTETDIGKIKPAPPVIKPEELSFDSFELLRLLGFSLKKGSPKVEERFL